MQLWPVTAATANPKGCLAAAKPISHRHSNHTRGLRPPKGGLLPTGLPRLKIRTSLTGTWAALLPSRNGRQSSTGTLRSKPDWPWLVWAWFGCPALTGFPVNKYDFWRQIIPLKGIIWMKKSAHLTMQFDFWASVMQNHRTIIKYTKYILLFHFGQHF